MQYKFIRGNDESAPLFVMLHASGGTEDDLIPLVKKWNESAPVLSIRGNELDHERTAFFRLDEHQSVTEEHITEKAEEIATFLQNILAKHHVDTRQIVIVGLSTGATMALHLLLTNPHLFTGAILYHPLVYNIFPKRVDLTGKHIFVGATKNDPYIKVEETEKLSAYLQDKGAHVTLHWEHGYHYLTGEEFAASRVWFEDLEKEL